MKPILPTPPSLPIKTTKPDPLKRLSLAVKKLDQLIDRAHQLGSFTDQLLREDQTGPSLPSSEIAPALLTTSRSTSTDKEPNEQVDTQGKY
ncbi:MAG: hypothetical protein OEZ57_05190 [Nitrospirota bacterium]|nr:hypothetical protein [Nitrospirota bacterium]MDH5586169.1 hypothetical protein [Nitrospirota bacterium]MDH5774293.1 hypothetical protein [Nitrospirota bacterium]